MISFQNGSNISSAIAAIIVAGTDSCTKHDLECRSSQNGKPTLQLTRLAGIGSLRIK